MSECVEKINCPTCGGSSLQVFLKEDGTYDGFCFSNCQKYIANPYEDKPVGYKPPAPHRKDPAEIRKQLSDVRELPTVDIVSRKLKAETLRHFGVRVGLSQEDGETPSIMYFPHFIKGAVVSVKTKVLNPKRMWWIGSKKDVEPFGWRQALDSGSATLIVTEGEPDCLAVAQTLKELERNPDFADKFPAVISLTDGAGTAGKFFSKWLPEFKRNFKKVIYVPDTDEAGQKSAAIVSQLDPEICIAQLDGKDPNAMLIDGRKKALRNAILFNSETVKLDKVCTVDDLIEDAMKMPEWGYTFPWPQVTAMTCGFRRKEIYGLGGGTGCGKTSWAQELQSWIVNEHNNPVGVFMLEQPAGRTLKGIAGKFAGIPFHRPDVEFTQDQLKDAIEALRDKVYVYNNFGVIDWDSVKQAIRYMNVTFGVKDFFIDNMTCFVSHVSSSEANDILNNIMGDMATLALELDISIFYFSHLNAPKTGPSHERGGHVHESQFTGSRAMQRYSHYMFGLERNKDPLITEEERNTATFVLLKDREFGRSGNVPLFYNTETDQLRQLEEFNISTAEADSEQIEIQIQQEEEPVVQLVVNGEDLPWE